MTVKQHMLTATKAVAEELSNGQKFIAGSLLVFFWWGNKLVDAVVAVGEAAEINRALQLVFGIVVVSVVCIVFRDAPKRLLDILEKWVEGRKAA